MAMSDMSLIAAYWYSPLQPAPPQRTGLEKELLTGHAAQTFDVKSQQKLRSTVTSSDGEGPGKGLPGHHDEVSHASGACPVPLERACPALVTPVVTETEETEDPRTGGLGREEREDDPRTGGLGMEERNGYGPRNGGLDTVNIIGAYPTPVANSTEGLGSESRSKSINVPLQDQNPMKEQDLKIKVIHVQNEESKIGTVCRQSVMHSQNEEFEDRRSM